MSMSMSISVKQGLSELNSIQVQIDSGIKNSTFIDLKKNACSVSYQSILDLLERRTRIKASIVKSNAVTIVTIDGKTYTVADALERKRNIGYEKGLLSQMKYQWEDSIDEFYMHPEQETESQPFCSGPPCLNCSKCLMERYNRTKASISQRNAKLGKEQIVKPKVGSDVCCNCPPCWNCSKCCLCCVCASFCEHNVKASKLPDTCMGKNKAEFAENIKNLSKSIKEFESKVDSVLDESDTKTLIQ